MYSHMLTGYIGGTVLSRLLDHPKAKAFKITVLVRSPEKAEKLKAFGVEPIIGSYADLDKLEVASSKADIVIAAVSLRNRHIVRVPIFT